MTAKYGPLMQAVALRSSTSSVPHTANGDLKAHLSNALASRLEIDAPIIGPQPHRVTCVVESARSGTTPAESEAPWGVAEPVRAGPVRPGGGGLHGARGPADGRNRRRGRSEPKQGAGAGRCQRASLRGRSSEELDECRQPWMARRRVEPTRNHRGNERPAMATPMTTKRAQPRCHRMSLEAKELHLMARLEARIGRAT